jgi:hypothetical protein
MVVKPRIVEFEIPIVMGKVSTHSKPKGRLEIEIGFIDFDVLLESGISVFKSVFKPPFSPFPVEKIERAIKIGVGEAVVRKDASSCRRQVGALL